MNNMNIELYEHGLDCVLDKIEELLGRALNTNNRNERTKYISKALGMVAATRVLTIVTEEETENEQQNN